jgi:DNA-binding transcriptional MerR regulator
VTGRAMHWSTPGGIRGPQACRLAGITYRKLDYWDRAGLVSPSIGAARGSGSSRRYSPRDVLLLALVERFTQLGLTLQAIRRHFPDVASAIPEDSSRWRHLLAVWAPTYMTIVEADDLVAHILKSVETGPVGVVALALVVEDLPSEVLDASDLEHTAPARVRGSMPPPADPASQPRMAVAGEGGGVLDPLHDTARVLTHAGGIQTGA